MCFQGDFLIPKTNLRQHIWEKELKIRPLSEKKAKLEAELLLTSQLESDGIGYSTVQSSIAGVRSQLAPLVNEKKDLITQFVNERKSVLYFEGSKLKLKDK